MGPHLQRDPNSGTQTKFPKGKYAEVPGSRQQSQKDAETPSRCRLSPTAIPTLPGGWERSAERPGAQPHPGRRHSPRGPWSPRDTAGSTASETETRHHPRGDLATGPQLWPNALALPWGWGLLLPPGRPCRELVKDQSPERRAPVKRACNPGSRGRDPEQDFEKRRGTLGAGG